VDAKASSVDLPKVRKDIIALIDSDADKRNDGTSLTGTFVRLAWHCSGTYAKADNSGGSNGGRMRFNKEASYGGNAGLKMAREALEPIKAANPEISYADLYTLSGVVAVENASGPTIPFRLGREDFKDGDTSPDDGRLPDADKGAPSKTIVHIRDVFKRLGFTEDKDMVALCGAHALGRCHTDASGYWGPWNFSENTMSTEYYRLLVEEEWTIKKTHNGKKWTGPEQYEDKTGKLMMLPSDIALIQDSEFKKIVEKYAKDEDLFFKDFSAAFSKLLELGVPFPKPWYQIW
jgi:cytochrome c peroxidase